jgi:hypothetical protein
LKLGWDILLFTYMYTKRLSFYSRHTHMLCSHFRIGLFFIMTAHTFIHTSVGSSALYTFSKVRNQWLGRSNSIRHSSFITTAFGSTVPHGMLLSGHGNNWASIVCRSGTLAGVELSRRELQSSLLCYFVVRKVY